MSAKKTKIFKTIATGSRDSILKLSRDFISSGKDPNLRDQDTGGTLLHHIVSHCHRFVDPEMLSLVYTLACANIDFDAQDFNGDTALHCVVRQRGAYRLMVALIRCGTDTSIQNSTGMTAEDILRLDKPPGHEEMLHWYSKFSPGLWRALLEEKPDCRLIEKLLKSWCRLITVKRGEVINMKVLLHYDLRKMKLLKLVEKYESSIELAVALLGGQGNLARKWIKEGIITNFDPNISDHSHQFRYPDYREVPQPLLAVVWETNSYTAIDVLMDLQVNTSVLYTNDRESISIPLVFHLFNSSLRPKDLRTIYRVLEGCDVSVKNNLGQTLLFQAVSTEESLSIINLLLRKGVNLGVRDKLGRTARDLAESLGRAKYIQAIDDHVIHLVKKKDFPQIERLLLEGYNHVTNIVDSSGRSIVDIAKKFSSPQVYEIVRLGDAVQGFVKRVFRVVDEGNHEELSKLLSCKKYAAGRDICGRTPLLKAVLHRRRSLIMKLVSDCQFTINMQDNLGRSVLHYATLFTDDPDMLELLQNRGANPALTDVHGRRYKAYNKRVCGPEEHARLQREIQDAELDIYTFRTNFETSFRAAMRAADLEAVKHLVSGLAEHGDVSRYSSLLFDCVDLCREDIAVYLLNTGFRSDIWKQVKPSCTDNVDLGKEIWLASTTNGQVLHLRRPYLFKPVLLQSPFPLIVMGDFNAKNSKCDPVNRICALRECTHPMISLKQRAMETGCARVVKLINQMEESSFQDYYGYE